MTVTMPLVFQPGETEILVPVTIVDNDVLEPDEQFSAVLSNPGERVDLGMDTAEVNIIDDDGMCTCVYSLL